MSWGGRTAGNVGSAPGAASYSYRRGRGRGNAHAVSSGGNTWKRGQPVSTTTNPDGTSASSNSWVRPKDNDEVDHKKISNNVEEVLASEIVVSRENEGG